VVDRRAETAAISAIASGSQRITVEAISHLIARPPSAFAPQEPFRHGVDGRGFPFDLSVQGYDGSFGLQGR
jgi:hypothetical protein